jgi:hypothetical protein
MWWFGKVKKEKEAIVQPDVEYLGPPQREVLHERARQIIKNQNKQKKYEADCVEAHLCPLCGAVLKDWDDDHPSSPEWGVECTMCKFRKITDAC